MLYVRCQYLDGGLSNAILVDGWQSLVRPQREALSSIIDVLIGTSERLAFWPWWQSIRSEFVGRLVVLHLC